MKSVMSAQRQAARRIVMLVIAALLACCSAIALRAQTGTATISGLVTDPSGGLVVKAELELKSVERGSVTAATSNDAGIYVFTGIQPGQYQITVRKPGFKQVDFLGLVLNTQDHVQQNFRLQLGSVSESVTVTSDTEHMESDNPAVGLLVSRDFVENMPLNGRSFQDLIALAPGTVSSADGSGYYSVNGQRNAANNFTVDGVSANAGTFTSSSPNAGIIGIVQLSGGYPLQSATGTTQNLLSVDAMQEFQIQTSGYAAEYGRQPGGQVAITSRAGTNDYHGTAFDYFRNTALDANNWFAKEQGIPRAGEHQNDFGGTVGGPLDIPKVYNGKDKTFFFFSYEGLRLLLPGFISDFSVPTEAFRESAAPGVQPYLNAAPLPNGVVNPDGISALFSGSTSSPSNLDSIGVRLDQLVGAKLRVFGRFFETNSSAGAQFPLFLNTSQINTLGWTLGTTWSVTPNLVNELRLNYTRSGGTNTYASDSFDGSIPLALNLLVPSEYAAMEGGYFSAATVSVPGTALYVGTQLSKTPFIQHQFNLVDSFSWTRGAHVLKFGADYRRLHPLQSGGSYYTGLTIGSLSDIQVGNADSLFVESVALARPIYNNLSVYAEDHWKATRRLTFDYGVRWEFNPPPAYTNGIDLAALTSSNLATTQVAPLGTPLYQTGYGYFAPRIGFAFSLNDSPRHPLVLRAGSGIFYDTGQGLTGSGYGNIYSTNLLSNIPVPVAASNLVAPPLTLALTPPYQFLTFADPNLKLPYTEQWNLSLDYGLTSRNTLTVSYVGNEGKRLLFLAGYPNGFPNNPNFNLVDFVGNNAASSDYNALQVQDHGFLAPGLQLIASYTWAHAIDDASTEYNQLSTPWRGNSDNDVRQAFNAALNYELPSANSNRLERALTHGWLWASRFVAETGYPLNVIQGTYTLPNGQTENITPDLVAGVPVYLHNVANAPGGWQLNPAAFSPVPLNPNGSPTQQGTLGRNVLYGPGFWTLNTAVQRNFSLAAERLQLIFRVEAFNVFNHPNFSTINTNLSSATFGQATNQASIGVANPLYATGSPRSLQLLLKLQF